MEAIEVFQYINLLKNRKGNRQQVSTDIFFYFFSTNDSFHSMSISKPRKSKPPVQVHILQTQYYNYCNSQ